MIKIYTKTNCPKCEKLKEFLKDKQIPFQALDITYDVSTLELLRTQHPGAGFPVIEFEDQTQIAGDLNAMFERLNPIEKVEEIEQKQATNSSPDYFWGF